MNSIAKQFAAFINKQKWDYGTHKFRLSYAEYDAEKPFNYILSSYGGHTHIILSPKELRAFRDHLNSIEIEE